MADAVDLKSTEGNFMWVRIPPALHDLFGKRRACVNRLAFFCGAGLERFSILWYPT